MFSTAQIFFGQVYSDKRRRWLPIRGLVLMALMVVTVALWPLLLAGCYSLVVRLGLRHRQLKLGLIGAMIMAAVVAQSAWGYWWL